MYRIGITGGIATGKSTVSHYIQQQGYPVIDADQIARQIVEPGQTGLDLLVQAFGNQVLLADGTLNRQWLGEQIFSHDTIRTRVNTLLHPLIFDAIEQAIESLPDTTTIVFIDMPLLVEVGYMSQVDEVWLVYVDAMRQHQRLMARNQWSAKQAEAAINSQLSIEAKRVYATQIIDNQGDKAVTYAQVEKRLAQLASSDVGRIQ